MSSRFARLALAGLSVAGVAFAAGSAAAKPCPNIMLVLDQSGSMSQDPDGNDPPKGPSKWELLQGVIVDVVQQYGDHVPFGLELFTADALNDQVACENAAMITVPLAHSSAGAIITAIKAAMPLKQTNTGEAIKRAAAEMALANPQKANYIILVTDGDPNCNPIDHMASASNPESGLTPDYTFGQLDAARKRTPAVKTFVVGFDGTGVRKDWLDQMAYHGGTTRHPNCGALNMPPDPCYFQAGANAADFKTVIDTIVHDAGGGEFQGAICDDSCYTNKCPMGQICTTDEINPEPHCANDPCGGKSCGGDTFCRGGTCATACTKGCPGGQKCHDGKCVADKCASKTCNPNQACNPVDGNCIDFPCASCNAGAVCDVVTGKCVANQCNIITCPKGTTCVDKVTGDCSASAGGGGCDAGRSVDTTGLAFAVFALACFFMAIRRRPARA